MRFFGLHFFFGAAELTLELFCRIVGNIAAAQNHHKSPLLSRVTRAPLSRIVTLVFMPAVGQLLVDDLKFFFFGFLSESIRAPNPRAHARILEQRLDFGRIGFDLRQFHAPSTAAGKKLVRRLAQTPERAVDVFSFVHRVAHGLAQLDIIKRRIGDIKEKPPITRIFGYAGFEIAVFAFENLGDKVSRASVRSYPDRRPARR